MAMESIPNTGERYIAFAMSEGPDGEKTVTEFMVVPGGCYLIRDYILEGKDAGQRYCLSAAYDAEHAVKSWEQFTGDVMPLFEFEQGRLA